MMAIEADYADLTGLSGVMTTNQVESQRSTNRQADGGEPIQDAILWLNEPSKDVKGASF